MPVIYAVGLRIMIDVILRRVEPMSWHVPAQYDIIPGGNFDH